MPGVTIVGGDTTFSSSSAVTNTIVWDAWNDGYTSATSSTNIWTIWVRGSATTSTSVTVGTGNIVAAGSTTAGTSGTIIWGTWNNTYVESQEQVQARLRRNEEARQRQIQYNEEARLQRLVTDTERAAARERAALLLNEALSEQQRLELADKGHFSLRVIDSKTQEERLYRIRRGRSGNVDRVDASGRVLNKFCIHPIIACPDEDTMLAQKLMLEHDEETFLRTANRS